jgi:hypothetical protein
MNLQEADRGPRSDQIVWRQRAQEWVGRNGSYLGVIALFAGLGALAATEYMPWLLKNQWDIDAIWDIDLNGPYATAAFASILGGLSLIGAVTIAVVIAFRKPKTDATEDDQALHKRDNRRLHAALIALAIFSSFAITYASFVYAIDTNHGFITPEGRHLRYSTLNQDALIAGKAIGIPLTIAGGVCLLINGALYIKSQTKKKE